MHDPYGADPGGADLDGGDQFVPSFIRTASWYVALTKFISFLMNMMKNLSSSSNTITPHIINSIWKLRFLHADHRVGYKGPSRARLLASFGTSLVNKQTNKQQKLKEVLFTSTCSLLMLTLHLLVLHLLCPLFSFLPGQKPDCDDVRWLTVKW